MSTRDVLVVACGGGTAGRGRARSPAHFVLRHVAAAGARDCLAAARGGLQANDGHRFATRAGDGSSDIITDHGKPPFITLGALEVPPCTAHGRVGLPEVRAGGYGMYAGVYLPAGRIL